MHYYNFPSLLILALIFILNGLPIISGEPSLSSAASATGHSLPQKMGSSPRAAHSSSTSSSKSHGGRDETLLNGLFRLRVFWPDPPPSPPEHREENNPKSGSSSPDNPGTGKNNWRLSWKNVPFFRKPKGKQTDGAHLASSGGSGRDSRRRHKWVLVARFMHEGNFLWPEGEKLDELAAMSPSKRGKKNVASANNVHTIRLTHHDIRSAGGDANRHTNPQPFEYTLAVPGLEPNIFWPWTTEKSVDKRAEFWWQMMACALNGHRDAHGDIQSADGKELYLPSCAKTLIEIGFVLDDGSDLDRIQVGHRHCFSLAEIVKASGESNNVRSNGQKRSPGGSAKLSSTPPSSSSMRFVVDISGIWGSAGDHPSSSPVPTIRLDLVVANGHNDACVNYGKTL